MNPPLSPEEVAQFRGLVKPAIVLLVMLRLDRPVGAKEIAGILDLDEHTAARYLRTLSRLNLVARAGYHQGYIVLGGRQLILGAEPNVKNAHFASKDSVSSPLLQALQEAGVGEPKRTALAALPHLTPAYVKAWESQLKLAKGDRYSPGLLIHVLQTGDPAPSTNTLGHILNCPCPDCQRLKYLACPYCGHYPCQCP